MAKSVIESFPDVVSVRTVYYNPNNRASYRYVDVQRDMLKTFRGGKINDEQMLSALTVGASRVQRVSPSGRVELETYEPLKGVYRTERSMVLLKIRSLKDRGGNADELFQEFLSIEKNYIAKDKMEGFAVALNALSMRADAALVQANARLERSADGNQGPREGPYYDRRCAIARRLKELSINGTDVSALERVYRESIESAIGKPGSQASVENSLRFLESRLRLIR